MLPCDLQYLLCYVMVAYTAFLRVVQGIYATTTLAVIDLPVNFNQLQRPKPSSSEPCSVTNTPLDSLATIHVPPC